MSANFNLQIQSDHFGNERSLSIEGCMIEIINQDLNGTMEFYYHISDECSRVVLLHMHTWLVCCRNLETTISWRKGVLSRSQLIDVANSIVVVLVFYLLFLLTLISSLIIWLKLLYMEKIWFIELMLVISDILWENVYDWYTRSWW